MAVHPTNAEPLIYDAFAYEPYLSEIFTDEALLMSISAETETPPQDLVASMVIWSMSMSDTNIFRIQPMKRGEPSDNTWYTHCPTKATRAKCDGHIVHSMYGEWEEISVYTNGVEIGKEG